jgi:hypothetical protein
MDFREGERWLTPRNSRLAKRSKKLRGTDEPKSKMTRLDEKIDALDEETRRLRAMRRSLGPGKKAPTKRD